jgi:rod shape-determining protein MreC
VALPRRTGRSRLTLALLIITSLAVLTLDFREAGVIGSLRDAATAVFSPLRGAADALTDPFQNGWNGITEYDDVRAENDELRRRIEELEGERVRGEDALAELEALQEQLGIDFVGDIPRTTARVIAGPASNFAHTIEIDKGTADGIREGMPAVAGKGLVGRVRQATSSRATIQLLTDPDFRVGVRLVPEGILGTATGAGDGEPLVVDTSLDAETQLESGGHLVTSGADRSAFPASLPVGEVRETAPAGGGLSLDLIVEPFVDTGRLSFVTVLLWEGAG